MCSYPPVVDPSKTIPESRPKWAKSIPVFRPKRQKPYTYMAYKREYLPPPHPTRARATPFLENIDIPMVWDFLDTWKLSLRFPLAGWSVVNSHIHVKKKLEKINWLKGTRIVAASSKCFVSNCLLLWYRALMTNRYRTMKFCNKHTTLNNSRESTTPNRAAHVEEEILYFL